MKIKYLILICINLIKMSIFKIFMYGNLKSKAIQLISLSTKIDIDKKSKLYIFGRLHSDGNIFISSRYGGFLEIAGDVYINRNTVIVCRDKIHIGNGTTIGPNVVIYDHDHDIMKTGSMYKKPIFIGQNVWIGAGCIILKGVHIGNNCIIAAGTLVNKNIPDNKIVYNKRINEYKALGEE